MFFVALCALRDPPFPNKTWSQSSQRIHNGHEGLLQTDSQFNIQ